MLHLTAEPPVDQLHQAFTYIKQKILSLMKFGELYVHLYYYALNNIFI